MEKSCRCCTLRWSSGHEGDLEVEYADGTHDTVEAAVIQRSVFLQDILASDSSSEELTLLPEQQQSFASWLQFLRLHDDDKQAARNSYLLNYLQASDYLSDSQAVDEVCIIIASRLIDDSADLAADEAAAHAQHESQQLLGPLPRHLQVSVLQAAEASLDIIFSALPRSLQPQALCAQFPSITTSNSLSLQGKTLSPAGAVQAFAAAAHFDCLTSLHLTDIDVEGSSGDTTAECLPCIEHARSSQSALAGLMKCLTALQRLHISAYPLSDVAVHTVCYANAKLPALTFLHLSDMPVRHASELMCALCHIPGTPTATPPATTFNQGDGPQISGEVEHGSSCACMHATPAFASQLPSVSSPLEQLELDHLLFMHDGALLARALSCMGDLRNLKMTYSSMTDEDVSSLMPTMERLPQLNSIDLSFCQVEAVVANRLMGALFGLPTAHRMDHAPGTPDAAAYNAEVALALKAAHNVLPRLVAVVLPTCVYTHKCLMGLALILAGRNALKQLQGRNTTRARFNAARATGTDSGVAPSLATALVMLGALKQLDISFPGAFAHPHCSALSLLSNVQALTIDSDMMTGGNASAVACMSSVTSLYLLSGRIHANERCMQKLSPVISQFTQLQELQLPDFLQLKSDREAASLAVVLHACTLLEKLRLSVDGLMDVPVQTAAPALAQLGCLKSFHLTIKGWYEGEQLSTFMSCCSKSGMLQLEAVEVITHMHLQSATAHALLTGLAQLPKLRKLALRTTLDDEAAQVVASGLPRLPVLMHLELFPHPFSQQGSRILAKSLASMAQITRLSFEYKGYEHADAIALADSLQRLTNLVHVDLWRCFFHLNSGVRAQVICDALSHLSCLTFLDMGACDVSQPFADSLADVLGSNTNLQHLALRVSCPGAGERCLMGTVAQGLSKLRHLRHLELRPSNTHRHSGCGLAPAVAAMTRLTFLSIASTELSGTGAAILGEALARLRNLRSLYLTYSIGNEAQAVALLPWLTRLSSLRELYLGYSNFGEQGTMELARTLAALGTLQRVTFTGARMTEHGAEAVVAALAAHAGMTRLDLGDSNIATVSVAQLAAEHTWVRP